jgi:hypothetical protein
MDFDAVFPDNNEEKFIDAALRFGYKKILLVSRDLKYTYKSSRIQVMNGYLLKSQNELSKARKYFDYVFAPADRIFFEMKADFIVGSEASEKKDSLHFRSTELNQVHAKLAKENGICIVFDFSLLLQPRMWQRQKCLGKMMQIAVLAKKYGLKHCVFSLASDPNQMRSQTIYSALLRVLGL